MNNKRFFLAGALMIFIGIVLMGKASLAQSAAPTLLDKANPWSQEQLIQPAALNALLTGNKTKQPKIFNIGVVADIKGAKNVGAASDKVNLAKLKSTLSTIPKSTFLVIYCGCCPFDKCPNIRPAFKLMNDMGFKNARLLNLATSIKVDWINKNYPMAL